VRGGGGGGGMAGGREAEAKGRRTSEGIGQGCVLSPLFAPGRAGFLPTHG
jgi:hypothetical protein